MPFPTRSIYQKPASRDDEQIQRIIDFLDDTAVGYEARWGVGRLPALASSELATKWKSQIEKVNRAIETAHVADLETLAHGMQRGWAVLETYAGAAGHEPIDPDAWEFTHASGQVFRVVKNNNDACCPSPRPFRRIRGDLGRTGLMCIRRRKWGFLKPKFPLLARGN